MALVEFVNDSAPYLNAENLNNNFNELNNKIEGKGLTKLNTYEINTKETYTLSDNINNYDFIIILATSNAYTHRRIANIYLPVTTSSTNVQLLQYSPTDWDNNLKIYDNILDTTQCDNIGTDYLRIIAVYGAKL